MKHKQLLAIALAAFLTMSTLSGCLGAGQPETPADSPATQAADPSAEGETDTNAPAAPTGEIDTNAAFELRYIGSLMGEGRTPLLDEAEAKLKEKWPNVTFTNECTADYDQKMRLAFSSGEGQQLLYLDDLNQQTLEEGGYLMDITDYIVERGWEQKLTEGALEFNNLRHPGTNYSVPFLMAPILLYYNKDILEELEVSPPKTVDELETILQKAKDAGYVPTENGGDQYHHIGWMAQSIIQNSVPKNEIDDWYYRRGASDNVKQAFIDTYDRINGWVQSGYFREGFEGVKNDDISMLFSQGQTAVVIDGDWALNDYDLSGLNLGACAFPGLTEDSNVIVNAVDGAWALNANLDANQTAAALDWIDLFFDHDYVEKWYSIGFTPCVIGDYSGAEVSELKKESAAAVQGTEMGFYLDNVKPGFLDHITKQTQLLVLGEVTAETMWDALDAEWARED